MLTNLHVKNLALIEEADVEFGPGLNILTGETGAGKSIVLGSVQIALGGKTGPEIIRKGAEYALIELVFTVDDPEKIEALKNFGVEDVEDGEVVLTRKIMQGRSRIKVNGETFTAAQVRQIKRILIDIHGQHDNSALLSPEEHLKLVDSFCPPEADSLKAQLRDRCRALQKKRRDIKSLSMDESARNRELSFLQFEIEEIRNAQLKDDEDEQLEADYRRMSNSSRIFDYLQEAGNLLSEAPENLSDMSGQIIQAVSKAAAYDPDLEETEELLNDMDGLISDAARSVRDYMETHEYDEQEFAETESRLNTINSLKDKYGRTIPDILDECSRKEERLKELENSAQILEQMNAECAELEKEIRKLAGQLTLIRRKTADELCAKIRDSLKSLNFLDNRFEAAFTKLPEPGENGQDAVNFMIAVNPGEELHPLQKTASGGELSRIMLAVKTCMAEKDRTGTLIFDEIDAGISGRTAQKVAENLKFLAETHQIICITHLAQIAAMSDVHFLIEKTVEDGRTVTTIRKLTEPEIIDELSRILGGIKITGAVRKSAEEMRDMAKRSAASKKRVDL
ncbi:MAG: DNA repair protein RecN [Lachnospiraceae bacterium]|jgi:DNA repair protein RecN (Recombination protein N)